MRASDFDYDLPEDLIAQEPPARRDDSRLMVLRRASGAIEHARITDLPRLLAPGDLMVINDTRVIPARLPGRRAAPGTGGRVEVLLIERAEDPRSGEDGVVETWRCLLKGGGGPGDPIEFGSGLSGRVLRRAATAPEALIALSSGPGAEPPGRLIEALGHPPTPPYIRRGPADAREPIDRERYQTIWARTPGAVAAPTAGLHFTTELLGALRARDVAVAPLTLHVGPGTFQPVRCERVEDHRLAPEAYSIPEPTAAAVTATRARGGRVVAVGTTVTRALEAVAMETGGSVTGRAGRCDLFIRQGHVFRAVDALITNFHLPRSTLLMLVSAFAGRELVLSAYAAAIRERYRFYSYGDAMLVL